jgi:hypothetical protein
MRRILAIAACLTLLGFTACIPADAAPKCGVPHKPPCLTTTTPAPTTTTPPSPPPPGERIAVMLVNFSDDIRQPWTTGFIDSLYDGSAPSVSDFYTQASWGQLATSADVFGWFVTATPTSNCNLLMLHQQADAAATASGVDLSLYTNKVYIFPKTAACNFAGSGDMPGTRTWINLNPIACPEGTTNCQGLNTLVHELGHNLGLNHAGLLNCPGAVYGTNCTTTNLGDNFDVMSCCITSRLANVRLLQLGWIPPSQAVIVAASQTLTVAPATAQGSVVYLVPTGDGEYLYLENRADMTIYDPVLGDYSNGNLLFRKAPIYTASTPTPRGPYYSMTQLLDGSPFTNNGGNAKGLPVGSSFTVNGITITNVAFDGVNNVVEIEVSY